MRAHGFYARFGKRVLDAIGSGIALTTGAPLILTVAAMVRWRLGAPVVFAQPRPGRNGRVFTIYKFRSMTDERDHSGTLLSDAARLTPFGRFLRSTSLDELPELWNVLRGDMSLVGPRPLLVEYLGRYSPRQARRHEVRPGLTGWAQVQGRNATTWEQRFEQDVYYVDNISLLLDAKVVLMTLRALVSRDGINEPGSATRSPFLGTSAEADRRGPR